MNYFNEYSYPYLNSNKKQTKFKTNVSVVHIPKINETVNRHLKEILWWNYDDLLKFRQSSSDEIINLIKRNKSMTIKQAAKLLYQPGNMTIVYDPLNFE